MFSGWKTPKYFTEYNCQKNFGKNPKHLFECSGLDKPLMAEFERLLCRGALTKLYWQPVSSPNWVLFQAKIYQKTTTSEVWNVVRIWVVFEWVATFGVSIFSERCLPVSQMLINSWLEFAPSLADIDFPTTATDSINQVIFLFSGERRFWVRGGEIVAITSWNWMLVIVTRSNSEMKFWRKFWNGKEIVVKEPNAKTGETGYSIRLDRSTYRVL